MLDVGLPHHLDRFIDKWSGNDGLNPLPRRVLDLGEHGSPDSDLRLRECSKREHARYVALSHVWQRDLILQTTKGTLNERKERIAFSDLSSTFQDAVVMCRMLVIRYLWIDSLCIVQNDADDWERESSKMKDVYSRAFFTIKMHGSARNSMIHHDIPTPSARYPGVIHVRRVDLRPDFDSNIVTGPVGNLQKEPSNQRWNRVSQRGWCFQERALSRRNLHFTGQELAIEEEGMLQWCQCSLHKGSQARIGFSGSISSGHFFYPGRDDLAWREVVSQYSTRIFTFRWDVLPGLVGIAQTFADNTHLGGYVAGLWTTDLLRWLCWRSRGWEANDLLDQTRLTPRAWLCYNVRPRRLPLSPIYSVPSFSWASRFGPCEFMPEPLNAREVEETAKIIDFEQQTSPLNPLGRVIYCWIDISGPLYLCKHYSSAHNPKLRGVCMGEAWVVDEEFQERWDTSLPEEELLEHVNACGKQYNIDAMDDIPPWGSTVYLLELFCQRPSIYEPAARTIALVLVPEDEQSGVYIEQMISHKRGVGTQTFYVDNAEGVARPRMRRVGITGLEWRFEFATAMEDMEVRLV